MYERRVNSIVVLVCLLWLDFSHCFSANPNAICATGNSSGDAALLNLCIASTDYAIRHILHVLVSNDFLLFASHSIGGSRFGCHPVFHDLSLVLRGC